MDNSTRCGEADKGGYEQDILAYDDNENDVPSELEPIPLSTLRDVGLETKSICSHQTKVFKAHDNSSLFEWANERKAKSSHLGKQNAYRARRSGTKSFLSNNSLALQRTAADSHMYPPVLLNVVDEEITPGHPTAQLTIRQVYQTPQLRNTLT